ncbi:MAG TPA: hypothetical protein VF603_14290 [Allosphingosinicella sp.]|jgi:hypothetical protein
MTDIVAKGFSAALMSYFGYFRGLVTIDQLARTEWASVTFCGARHRLRVALRGLGAVGAAADFLADLPELEFEIRGHIVADVALLGEERGDGGAYAMLELEALTIEEN